ncbi:MAG TPA: hypothetical protein VHF69_08345, partial [Candidatus Synoicihabitans sp.]|nr:hypothetical protein [Candidatus Synoicihabitans sp.]
AGFFASVEPTRVEARPAEPRPSASAFHARLGPTVRADHPRIVPLAEAIRRLSDDPVEQLVIVDRVTRLQVDYDSDLRVYGRRDYHATLDEMIERRAAAGWSRLRDDCDGRAVFAAHLLAALDLPWRLHGSYAKRHAWVSSVIGGVRYDLLDLQAGDPETRAWSYRWLARWSAGSSRALPEFAWRTAWRMRTSADVEIGERLGLLEYDETTTRRRERYAVNWLDETRAAGKKTTGFASGDVVATGTVR